MKFDVTVFPLNPSSKKTPMPIEGLKSELLKLVCAATSDEFVVFEPSRKYFVDPKTTKKIVRWFEADRNVLEVKLLSSKEIQVTTVDEFDITIYFLCSDCCFDSKPALKVETSKSEESSSNVEKVDSTTSIGSAGRFKFKDVTGQGMSQALSVLECFDDTGGAETDWDTD